jgi:hypothetical protein
MKEVVSSELITHYSLLCIQISIAPVLSPK